MPQTAGSAGAARGAVNVALSGSRLDALLPQYDFTERHMRVIGRQPHAVYNAFKALTLQEMPVSRLLFAARSLPARLAGQRGLPSQQGAPLLDQFLGRGFVLLADVPGDELAAGVIGQMWRRRGRMVIPGGREEFLAFAEPGFVKAALMFRFIDQADGTTLVETETRVAATDPTARRGFGRYWLLIRGFSGLIRRDWLRAIARRAQRG
ncbi:MAG TPA: hypothetical protein VGS19_31085 [Streptosporangiaceae bacterium]|nr:hypothetical protein [Streptosporangiaceae bacterium]